MKLEILKERFSKNMDLHPQLEWSAVEKILNENKEALSILEKMEESGGEPDTIGFDDETGKLIFCDCAKETPLERRSLCYDDEALKKRTKNPPAGSALAMAQMIGSSLLTEELYYRLQQLSEFDLKTSSWIMTPEEIRTKGGALFCERRYGKVFTFHNSADSYYSVRGFRTYIML